MRYICNVDEDGSATDGAEAMRSGILALLDRRAQNTSRARVTGEAVYRELEALRSVVRTIEVEVQRSTKPQIAIGGLVVSITGESHVVHYTVEWLGGEIRSLHLTRLTRGDSMVSGETVPMEPWTEAGLLGHVRGRLVSIGQAGQLEVHHG